MREWGRCVDGMECKEVKDIKSDINFAGKLPAS